LVSICYPIGRSSRQWKCLVHSNNAPIHISKVVTDKLAEQHLKRIAHPSSGPDLSSCDFFLFGYLKDKLIDWLISSRLCPRDYLLKWQWWFQTSQVTWFQESLRRGRKDCKNAVISEGTTLSKCCISADLRFYEPNVSLRFRPNIEHSVLDVQQPRRNYCIKIKMKLRGNIKRMLLLNFWKLWSSQQVNQVLNVLIPPRNAFSNFRTDWFALLAWKKRLSRCWWSQFWLQWLTEAKFMFCRHNQL
jgi:hypothetical protein